MGALLRRQYFQTSEFYFVFQLQKYPQTIKTIIIIIKIIIIIMVIILRIMVIIRREYVAVLLDVLLDSLYPDASAQVKRHPTPLYYVGFNLQLTDPSVTGVTLYPSDAVIVSN